jgi:hypothetical protein
VKRVTFQITTACFFLSGPALLLVQNGTGLEAEFSRLQVSTALVIPSQAVDEYPVWSPDAKHLAVNVMGVWYKLDLSKVKLKEAKWLGMKIGAPESLPDPEKIQAAELDAWKRSTKRAPRKLKLESGIEVELRQTSPSTSFVVRKPDGKESILWKTNLEDCYEISAPQGEKFVAFICATNGVLVSRAP